MTEREADTEIAEASGPILIISKVFSETSKIFIIIFLFDQASWKFKHHQLLDTKYWFEFIGHQKNIPLLSVVDTHDLDADSVFFMRMRIRMRI